MMPKLGVVTMHMEHWQLSMTGTVFMCQHIFKCLFLYEINNMDLMAYFASIYFLKALSC